MTDLPQMLLDAVKQHLPTGAAWAPPLILATIGVIGLVLLVRGARIAATLGAVVFLAAGAAGGLVVAHATTAPCWLCTALGAAVGAGLGALLFRLWMAALLAGCAMSAALFVYAQNSLRGALQTFVAGDGQSVTLPAAAAPPPGTLAGVAANLAALWKHLGANVPNFEANVLVIVICTGLVGLAVGLLLPRVSRALGAATAGTFLFAGSLYALADAYWPDALIQTAVWQRAGLLLVWGASALFGWYDLSRPKKKPPARPPAEPPPAAKR